MLLIFLVIQRYKITLWDTLNVFQLEFLQFLEFQPYRKLIQYCMGKKLCGLLKNWEGLKNHENKRTISFAAENVLGTVRAWRKRGKGGRKVKGGVTVWSLN